MRNQVRRSGHTRHEKFVPLRFHHTESRMKFRSTKLNALILASCMAVMLMAGTPIFAQSSADVTPGTMHERQGDKIPANIEKQLRQMQRQIERQQEEIDQLKKQLQGPGRQPQEAGKTAQQIQPIPPVVEAIREKPRQTVVQPDGIHYKGIAISPKGSFIEGATVYRSAATGGGINTPLTGIPLQHSDAAQMSEFYGSGRQSRVALKATGRLDRMTLTGYFEADWLGTGSTSNNNQSNSYVLRQRQLWLRSAMDNGWAVSVGEMWSLVTETAEGESNGTEVPPSTIDPQFTAGFTWARQYGFRVAKGFKNKFWLGASAENPQTLNPAGSALPTNLVIGSSGNSGGLHNPTANYSFNLAPDMIAKAVLEPGWGHYEIFGLARFFRDRIYPATGPPYNDSTVAGGIGGGIRAPLANKKITLGLKGLWGGGVGRYGDSAIADITLRPDGSISPLHAFSALATLEYYPTKRLNIWSNYGGDYVGRDYVGNVGYGTPLTDMSGCNTEPPPGTSPVNGASSGFSPSNPNDCGGNNKDVQELSVGYWFRFYDGAKGGLRQGIQYSRFRRDLWSGAGGTTNPGGGAYGTDNAVWTSFRYFLP